MARTPPVSWGEMVADPTSGACRILGNQIADRDEMIAVMREALESAQRAFQDQGYCGPARDLVDAALTDKRDR
jgi:hypothetical protein